MYKGGKNKIINIYNLKIKNLILYIIINLFIYLIYFKHIHRKKLKIAIQII